MTYEVNENLIIKIEQEANKELEEEEIALLFSVTLKNGEKLTLTADTEAMEEIINMINYDGTIWYAQD